jgi:hypothetical protein
MQKKITGLMIILFVFAIGISQAQVNKRYVAKKAAVYTGLEQGNPNAEVISYNTTSHLLPTQSPVGDLMFNFNPTNLWSGYDYPSNGTAHLIWADTTNPMNIHAVYMWSSELGPNFTDRTCQYLYSFDGGASWLNTGQVPPSGNRSGYCVVDGYYSSGIALVGCHTFNGSNPDTRAMLYKDDDVGAGTFSTEWDPGEPATGQAIWPRVAVINDDNVALAASENQQADSLYVNFYNTTNGWAGWQSFPGDQAETYSWAVSEDGSRVGLLYSGNVALYGNVYFVETTDYGVTWNDGDPPYLVWETTLNQDSITMGCLRGLDLVYLGDSPCATFEVAGVTSTGLYADYPSSIYFWNPSINGGVPFSIADSSSVPFNTHWYYTSPANTIEAFTPICRPAIGKSARQNALFVGFVATTPYYYGDTTSNNVESYYAGWFTYSLDSGATWTDPVQFTPDSMDNHLQDNRFVSIAKISPVQDSICTVQMMIQPDSIPGSQVQYPAFTPKISATEYNVTVDVTLPYTVGVSSGTVTPYSYSLQQNYPNPFNPTTTINYSLAKRSNVVLKVFNMLGQEVATLVNSQQAGGSHSIDFDASKLASGLYIYKLEAGDFTMAKKMMLLK